MRLNLASGDRPLAGYVNVDLYCSNCDVVDDMVTLASFGDEIADEVRCDHGLEHLCVSDIPKALASWQRVLKPGGRLQIDVPDLPRVVDLWLADYRAMRPDIWGWRTQTLFGRPGECHQWGFDSVSLRHVVERAGFVVESVTSIDSHGQPSLLLIGRKS